MFVVFVFCICGCIFILYLWLYLYFVFLAVFVFCICGCICILYLWLYLYFAFVTHMLCHAPSAEPRDANQQRVARSENAPHCRIPRLIKGITYSSWGSWQENKNPNVYMIEFYEDCWQPEMDNLWGIPEAATHWTLYSPPYLCIPSMP